MTSRATPALVAHCTCPCLPRVKSHFEAVDRSFSRRAAIVAQLLPVGSDASSGGPTSIASRRVASSRTAPQTAPISSLKVIMSSNIYLDSVVLFLGVVRHNYCRRGFRPNFTGIEQNGVSYQLLLDLPVCLICPT